MGPTLPPVVETREPTSAAEVSNTRAPSMRPGTTKAPTALCECENKVTAAGSLGEQEAPNQTPLILAAVSGWAFAIGGFAVLARKHNKSAGGVGDDGYAFAHKVDSSEHMHKARSEKLTVRDL
jgi:hypothetical protein